METVEKVNHRLKFLGNASDDEFLNLVIADHLSHIGCLESSKKVALRKNQAELVDELRHDVADEIVAGLTKQDLQLALDWSVQNKAILKRSNSTLEFQLHKFAFLSLVEKMEIVVAVKYAKKNFGLFVKEHLEEIQKTMSILAFFNPVGGKKRKINPQTHSILSQENWDALATFFKFECQRARLNDRQSTLQLIVKAGLSVLRTDQCGNNSCIECPCCCSHDIEVPRASLMRSFILCRCSGLPMVEQALALPNGQVFSEAALKAIAARHPNRKVTCPVTNEQFDWIDLKKVYIA